MRIDRVVHPKYDMVGCLLKEGREQKSKIDPDCSKMEELQVINVNMSI